jgi:outer membrane protein TolC
MTTVRPFFLLVIASVMIASARPARAQTTPLTLADALRMATDRSEALDAARAGEARSIADIERVRSQNLPQLSFTGTYSRTLASEFSSAFESSGPVCTSFTPNTSSSISDRITELERAGSCGAWGSNVNFADLPFGQKNNYQLGFTFSQPLYTGGRVAAAKRQAQSASQSATLTTASTTAQLQLDVARAFYDAALGDRLVAIAEQTVAQAVASYEQTRLSYEAGRQPEFEVLRAQVSQNNQQSILIRRRADREVAYLRLKQLLELPANAPLTLDVGLDAGTLPPPAPFAADLAQIDTVPVLDRVTVAQSRAVVDAREAAVDAAKAERRPSVTLLSSYAGVGYPSNAFVPQPSDFRTNASVGMSVQVPIFTGFRIRAMERAAEAELAQAQALLRQTQELAVLDDATARQDLASAEAAWEATAGTVQQAERAYQIAELRNREGLSTQLELSDSRLALEIAQANRAVAARDLQVARVRVALLPGLPLGAR